MQITELIITALCALIALTVHEYAHGYAAYRLGDNTARNQGRLTLNPIKHVDPVGAICLILFHFGWARPVPISLRNFKKPRRDFALTALAGPASNLLLAIFTAFFYLLFYRNFNFQGTGFLHTLGLNFLIFLSTFFIINLGLCLFNLIPVPPLDGSRILGLVLPARTYFKIMRYERRIYYVFLAWLLLGSYVYAGLMSLPFVAASPILSGIARIFSLSGLLSDLISLVAGLIINFWTLIPFLR